MQRSLHSLLLILAAFSCSALAHGDRADDDGYAIQSLNAPDPIFTAADAIAIRVTTPKVRHTVVRLNGDDVTSALAESEPGVLTGTVVGLQPGINTLEVFKNRGERHAVAGLKVARAKGPSVACSLSSFPAAALPVANTVVTSA